MIQRQFLSLITSVPFGEDPTIFILLFWKCKSYSWKINTVSYAQTLTTIPDDIIQLIKQARKFLLFTEINIWMKKGENALSDVTMGSHDGVEVCELVGIYLLEKLSNIIDKICYWKCKRT